MKGINLILLLLSTILLNCKDCTSDKPEKIIDGKNQETSQKIEKIATNKPTVSLTFDDGNTSDLAGIEFEKWNEMILTHLEEENLKAIFFVTGKNKSTPKGKYLLEKWNDNGHKIANHSFSHPNFNSEKNTHEIFEKELIKTDSIIATLGNSIKLFRFPYLKEGEKPSKTKKIREILAENDYSNGYVTIDASDWYVDQRLIERIQQVGIEKTEIDGFKDFYVQHIMERANYYEKLSYEINQRHINHTLLLHHNLTSALFLDDVIKKFKETGWELIDADQAYRDEIFEKIPKTLFAGESLIYSMAKQSGNFEESLRYPAEDSRYERKKMNELGL